MGRSQSKIAEEDKTVDTDREEKESRIKGKVTFPTSGGKATNPENMEDLYASVWSWSTKEENSIPLPYCKRIGEYQ